MDGTSAVPDDVALTGHGADHDALDEPDLDAAEEDVERAEDTQRRRLADPEELIADGFVPL